MTTDRVFELRTYYAAPGKLDALHRRFREHTLALFAKHGMELVAFFSPTDEPDRDNALVYVLAFPDRASADQAWEAFRADPEWISVKSASEVDGSLTERVESVFLSPTDYSPLR
ncbi:NIPSNAP family protein [Actinopolymorpha pittospori]